MRALLLCSTLAAMPILAAAQSQCAAAPEMASRSLRVAETPPLAPRLPPAAPGAATASGNSSPALDHVAAAGAVLTEAGSDRGLRTVVAHAGGQFLRLHVSPDGQAVVAGIMADLSVAQLTVMAGPVRPVDLGTLHGLRGLLVRNGPQFQVYYATPDEQRVIPGVMFDAAGRNLTRDQVANVPGAVPTVTVGDGIAGAKPASPALPAALSSTPPPSPQSGSLISMVEVTTHGVVGAAEAPRLWVFVDPLCGHSVQALDRLRAPVSSGRVQLAVIPVAVLDPKPGGPSAQAAGAMLSLPQGEMVQAWTKGKLASVTSPDAPNLLAANHATFTAMRTRGTPFFVWRKPDGTEGRAEGLPADLDALLASVSR